MYNDATRLNRVQRRHSIEVHATGDRLNRWLNQDPQPNDGKVPGGAGGVRAGVRQLGTRRTVATSGGTEERGVSNGRSEIQDELTAPRCRSRAQESLIFDFEHFLPLQPMSNAVRRHDDRIDGHLASRLPPSGSATHAPFKFFHLKLPRSCTPRASYKKATPRLTIDLKLTSSSSHLKYFLRCVRLLGRFCHPSCHLVEAAHVWENDGMNLRAAAPNSINTSSAHPSPALASVPTSSTPTLSARVVWAPRSCPRVCHHTSFSSPTPVSSAPTRLPAHPN
ncbi:hypothetical protein DFH09DRAFT_1407064 [Mycena vulgaris]|nr:hypothetical protein DFH09DRAFT_1407064 [Mycena vulgaris]